jgi:hypothetical protein
MGLSVAETEQVLQRVHDTLMSLIYDDVSGIPGIRDTLGAHGLKLNIQIEASVDSTTMDGKNEVSELGLSTLSSNLDDGLLEWQGMGIRIDDLREAAQIQARRNDEAEEAVLNRIRTVAGSLSSRGRNYTWGWLNLYYPEIGLGPNPTTIRDQRFALLSAPIYWREIVETALTAIRARVDRVEVLSRFLTTLNFAKANT